MWFIYARVQNIFKVWRGVEKRKSKLINPCYTPLVRSSFDNRAHALRILILSANRTVKVLCPSSFVSFLPCRVGNHHVLQDRAIACFLRNKVFSLATHLKIVHGRRQSRRLSGCPYCGRPYKGIDSFFKHLVKRHPTRPPHNN